jgi:hypothetical protein
MDNDMICRQRKKDIHDVRIDWYLLKNTELIINQNGLTGLLVSEWKCQIW